MTHPVKHGFLRRHCVRDVGIDLIRNMLYFSNHVNLLQLPWILKRVHEIANVRDKDVVPAFQGCISSWKTVVRPSDPFSCFFDWL
jgi:hypothetical protein